MKKNLKRSLKKSKPGKKEKGAELELY
jgi:hypothetical protein